MLQDPNPTDYPELEKFCDWLYENYGKLPQDFESLKKAQVEYSALCAVAEAAKALMQTAHQPIKDILKYGEERTDFNVHRGLALSLKQALDDFAKFRS